MAGLRAFTVFGKLGRELGENLDTLIGVDQVEVDDKGHPTVVGQITLPDGSHYEMRVTLTKEGEAQSGAATTATLSKAQKDAVEKARAKRKRAPKK
ncbi:MAG: hypothetical protein KAI25_07115 [Hyphomicrobiaceae bacterium]|nr:hypothetical protein [Hyphomicrobiaceae bacterium]